MFRSCFPAFSKRRPSKKDDTDSSAGLTSNDQKKLRYHQSQSLKVATVRGDSDRKLNLDPSKKRKEFQRSNSSTSQLTKRSSHSGGPGNARYSGDYGGLTRGSSKDLASDNGFMTRAFENAANVEGLDELN